MNVIGIILFLILFLAAASSVFEVLAQSAWGRKKSGEQGTLILLSLTAALLEGITAAMILAVLGGYRMTWILVIYVVTALVLRLFLVKKGKSFWSHEGLSLFFSWKPDGLLLAFLVIASVLYLAFPTHYLLGGRDYGLYLINGVHIAETGSSSWGDDELLAELPLEVRHSISQYPGLYRPMDYGESDDPYLYSPQFLPLVEASYAMAYDLGGLPALLRANGLFVLFILCWGYVLARTFLGRKAAWIFTGFLLICPAQLWNGRVTQSEMVAELLFFLAAWFFAEGWREEHRGLFFWSALLTGLGCFNRIDHYLACAAVYILLIYAVLWKKRLANRLMGASALTAGISGLALLYTEIFHPVYLHEHWSEMVKPLTMMSFALFFLGLLLWLIVGGVRRHLAKKAAAEAGSGKTLLTEEARSGDNLPAEKKQRRTLPEFLLTSRVFLILLGILLVLAVIFLYLVYPRMVEGFFGHAFTEFSWYVSYIGMFAAVFGICAFMYGKRNKSGFVRYTEPLLLFSVTGLMFLMLYTLIPRITPDHFWATRRWISFAIPFILFWAAAGCRSVGQRCRAKGGTVVRRILAAALAAGIAVCMIWPFRNYLFTSSLEGIEDGYEALAAELPDDGIIMTQNGNIAPILRFVYHKPVFYQTDMEECFRDPETKGPYLRLAESGTPVYFLCGAQKGDDWQLIRNYDIRIYGVMPQIVEAEYPEGETEFLYTPYLYYLEGEAT